MITADDLATAVKARCDASAAFTAAIPGAVYFTRGPDAPTAYPFAVFTVERVGDAEYQSDLSYTQEWTVRMAAYCPIGQAGVDPQAAQLGMSDAMNTNPTGWDALRDGKVLHALPEGFDGTNAPELRAGRDVGIVAGQWKLLVYGNAAP